MREERSTNALVCFKKGAMLLLARVSLIVNSDTPTPRTLRDMSGPAKAKGDCPREEPAVGHLAIARRLANQWQGQAYDNLDALSCTTLDFSQPARWAPVSPSVCRGGRCSKCAASGKGIRKRGWLRARPGSGIAYSPCA